MPGIEAEAVRQRTDEAIGGQVQVRITDTGDEPFTVTSVALDSPGFEPLPPREHTTDRHATVDAQYDHSVGGTRIAADV